MQSFRRFKFTQIRMKSKGSPPNLNRLKSISVKNQRHRTRRCFHIAHEMVVTPIRKECGKCLLGVKITISNIREE
jgi:hypothetical protein